MYFNHFSYANRVINVIILHPTLLFLCLITEEFLQVKGAIRKTITLRAVQLINCGVHSVLTTSSHQGYQYT